MAFYPQTNGQFEKVIQILEDMLRVWSLMIGAEIWDTFSWMQDPKLCSETNGRSCYRVGERPRNADLMTLR
ncbi:hypothetical protein LguiA_007376 [Lonicera macranthoides]